MQRLINVFYASIVFFATFPSASAMKLSGELRISSPADLVIESVLGDTLIHIRLESNGVFTSAETDLPADVYYLRIADSRETVYLDGTDVTINGFLDPKSPEKSELRFTGIDANNQFSSLLERFRLYRRDVGKWIDYSQATGAPISMVTGVLALYPPQNYEEIAPVLELIPQHAHVSASYRMLAERAEQLSRYRIGAPAAPFSLIDQDGKTVSLADFRGKYVLLDFWASWCGPCKAELKKLIPFYEQKLTDKRVEFISISLDETEADWRKGLEEEKIPWATLWDSRNGFDSPIKEEYGFNAIPFVVIIDPEGNILRRHIRSPQTEEFISTLDI